MVVFYEVRRKQACRRMLMQSQWIILYLSSLAQSSEICTFVKCIVCMFSGLNTPKLQTSGLTRRCQALSVYQTHSVKHYRRY